MEPSDIQIVVISVIMGNSDIIERPKGFLVMDTCCFVDYIEKNNEGFDYDRIKSFIKESSYWVVITPYTLYEIIQKLNSISDIKTRRDNLLAIGDFWVVNMNGVLEYEGFEYGLDFLFHLHMTRDEDILIYDEERSRLRKSVYRSLYKKMFFFAQLVAVCCVVFEECDARGVISSDAALQIKMIDNFFEDKKDFFEWCFDRFFAQSEGKGYLGEDGCVHRGHDAKELLVEQLWDLTIQILSKTRVQRDIVTREEKVDDNEYNRRIVEQYYYYSRDKYKDNKKCLNRLLKDCKKRTSGKVDIGNIVLFAFNKSHYDINMSAYKLLLEKIFDKNGAGKKFCNHFIDMTTVTLVETIKNDNVIVLTADKVWQELLLNSDYRGKELNINFYNTYRLAVQDDKLG